MPKTTNLIAVANKDKRRSSCFLVRPSPGSRRTDFIPSNQIPEVEDMIFVSNCHILVQFKNKMYITFKANGSICEQSKEVQQYLDHASKKLSESVLENNTKYFALLCNEEEGPTVVVLFFNSGKARTVAKFLDKDKYETKGLFDENMEF